MLELVSQLREISSFAAIWLSTWLLLFGCLYLVYPLIRRALLRWHPATASNAVLGLMALPFCTSLLASLLLFGGLLQLNLVTAHYHGTDCESQFPRLESTWAVMGVLGLSALALVTMFGKLLAHLWAVRALRKRLLLLGETHADWCLLPNDEKLVFTLGWVSNDIFITEGLFSECSERDLAIILEHERAHARRRDNLRLLLGRLMLLAVPAPLARRLLDDLHLFVEASCDFVTAARHDALDVAETLLRVQRLVPERFICCNRSLIAAFTGAEVESRVRLLVDGDAGKRVNPLRFWMFLPLLLLLSVELVDPMHHAVELLLGSIQAAF
jgi:Zn-dependent protease with chaperone function